MGQQLFANLGKASQNPGELFIFIFKICQKIFIEDLTKIQRSWKLKIKKKVEKRITKSGQTREPHYHLIIKWKGYL